MTDSDKQPHRQIYLKNYRQRDRPTVIRGENTFIEKNLVNPLKAHKWQRYMNQKPWWLKKKIICELSIYEHAWSLWSIYTVMSKCWLVHCRFGLNIWRARPSGKEKTMIFCFILYCLFVLNNKITSLPIPLGQCNDEETTKHRQRIKGFNMYACCKIHAECCMQQAV